MSESQYYLHPQELSGIMVVKQPLTETWLFLPELGGGLGEPPVEFPSCQWASRWLQQLPCEDWQFGWSERDETGLLHVAWGDRMKCQELSWKLCWEKAGKFFLLRYDLTMGNEMMMMMMIDDWWLMMIDDWWLMMIDDWWLMMIDDWWLMMMIMMMIDDWWLMIMMMMMIDDWWLMIDDWCCNSSCSYITPFLPALQKKHTRNFWHRRFAAWPSRRSWMKKTSSLKPWMVPC